MTIKHHFEKIIKPHYQVVLILITSILLIILTLGSLHKFRNLDPAPSIISIEQLKKENKNITPITTGIYVRNFLNFDIPKNEFIVELIVWFIVDPLKIPVDLLERFSFSKGTFLKGILLKDFTTPIITKLNDGKELIQYDLRVKFSSNLNYRLFPLDSHRLYLTITNKYLSANDFYFDVIQDRFSVSNTIYTFGWNNIANHIKTGFTEYPLDKSDISRTNKYPRIIISFDFILDNIRNILLIFMPLFVVFFLSLFSFSFDPTRNQSTIMSISTAVVPAILAYRFVIEAVSPKVTYFMLSDQIFNMFLLLSFLIFFINEFYLAKIRQYRGLLVLSFHIILVLSWFYLLYIWV